MAYYMFQTTNPFIQKLSTYIMITLLLDTLYGLQPMNLLAATIVSAKKNLHCNAGFLYVCYNSSQRMSFFTHYIMWHDPTPLSQRYAIDNVLITLQLLHSVSHYDLHTSPTIVNDHVLIYVLLTLLCIPFHTNVLWYSMHLLCRTIISVSSSIFPHTSSLSLLTILRVYTHSPLQPFYVRFCISWILFLYLTIDVVSYITSYCFSHT